ncbi:MAG: hypothetical protein OXI66_00635 [Boseongicola sp.]|nr:hypothetical protein [Boseongicola sp.]
MPTLRSAWVSVHFLRPVQPVSLRLRDHHAFEGAHPDGSATSSANTATMSQNIQPVRSEEWWEARAGPSLAELQIEGPAMGLFPSQ